ncbi:hypothetical protein [Erythrobacter aureus]|uniref:Uncharacterized protein n=1 Tax=Erythrobacter aureus TaxID=2182384 RepID=A0A345YIU6_9SPHN|nr:hypothetical protein [Erythrobacter aureus]AXK43848.1 hypothetical protein DVR09_15450 [Erythrobacter aureus]
MAVSTMTPTGKLAYEFGNRRLPLQVLQSGRGFYLGTADDGGPVSRESAEYWPTYDEAEGALDKGPDAWTQRDEP